MVNVIDSCFVTTPQATKSTGTVTRNFTPIGKDCLCPFPSEGGFEIQPDLETIYFNDFKIIVEDRFRHYTEISRSENFRISPKSIKDIIKKCTGRDLSINETSVELAKARKKYPFFPVSDDKQKNTDYAKICMTVNLWDSGYSFGFFNRIFNNNLNLITVYKFDRDENIWGTFSNTDRVSGKAVVGMNHGLAMDNFLKIHKILDPRNNKPELFEIGYRYDFFSNIAFVMLLHEVAEGHFAQNLAFYRSQPEYREIEQWVKSSDPYVPSHLMALKAQAKELGVDMCIGMWLNMDEQEGEGLNHEYHAAGSASGDGSNGAECLITYKKSGKGYIKCTYAFRIKDRKFHNERTAPGRRWDNTFGCVMLYTPGVRTIMTGHIDSKTYNYELYNYIENLNDSHDTLKKQRNTPSPVAPSNNKTKVRKQQSKIVNPRL